MTIIFHSICSTCFDFFISILNHAIMLPVSFATHSHTFHLQVCYKQTVLYKSPCWPGFSKFPTRFCTMPAIAWDVSVAAWPCCCWPWAWPWFCCWPWPWFCYIEQDAKIYLFTCFFLILIWFIFIYDIIFPWIHLTRMFISESKNIMIFECFLLISVSSHLLVSLFKHWISTHSDLCQFFFNHFFLVFSTSCTYLIRLACSERRAACKEVSWVARQEGVDGRRELHARGQVERATATTSLVRGGMRGERDADSSSRWGTTLTNACTKGY